MSDVIEAGQWIAMIDAAAQTVREKRDYLSELDSTVGDGDHGTNLARALSGAAGDVKTMSDAGPDGILNQVSLSLQSQMGGAAGAIFGGFFLGLSSELDQGAADGAQLAAALRAGLAQVQKRGRAEPGGKTVVDALKPAANAAASAAEAGSSAVEVLRRAADAAESGAEATRDMVARYGRAKFLGQRSLGYRDAGATSMALILSAMADAAARKSEG